MCTVCNRYHEDFAHVVDVDREGNVQATSTSHDLIRNNTDDSDNGGDSGRNSPRPNRAQLSNNRNNQTGTFARVQYYGEEEDDDVDLSGNDLIPPSYDLSPPSYDEAVNMPKPESTDLTRSTHQTEPTETDPLYQNIDTFTRDAR